MIEIVELSKTYEGEREPAVRQLSLESPKGKFLTLLGPSGCGKSTTLRSIAGLERPDEGEIGIDGTVVFSSARRINLSPARRRIGMVFQSYAVWPHMTVHKNVEYPLKRQRVPKGERRARVEEALELVGLTELADRPAPNLSGGQQQRVALARAIVGQPKVLLLDEPLSNLDAKLRRELGSYLRALQQRLELTVVYVTHDQDEAMAMSDIVALMSEGKILEWGVPEEIYRQPETAFGARFLGAVNFLEGRASRLGGGWTMAADIGKVLFSDRRGQCQDGPGVLMVRPENIVLEPRSEGSAPSSEINAFEARVQSTTFLGMYWESDVQLSDGRTFVVRTQGERWWDPGDLVTLRFTPDSCVQVGADETPATSEDMPEEDLAPAYAPAAGAPLSAPPGAGEIVSTQRGEPMTQRENR